MSSPEQLLENCEHNFFKAIQHNKIEDVKYILTEIESLDNKIRSQRDGQLAKAGSNVVNCLVLKKSGDSALNICARLDPEYLELVRFIVEEKGANVEQSNLEGKTALHDAAQFSNYPLVDYLLKRGANVNVVKRADWTPLMLACTKQDVQVIKILLENGADSHFVNKDGWNCCHIAAREGNVEIVRMLLDFQKTPETMRKLVLSKSRNGRRPVHSAVMHGHLEVTKLLLENVDIEEANVADHCGTTLVMEACRFGHVELIHYLVNDVRADLFKCNQQGLNCLHTAAEAGQSDVIDILVSKYQMDVNLGAIGKGGMDMTALHWAAKEGQSSAIKTLLNLGARTDMKDANGRTAFDLTVTYRHEGAAQEFGKR